MLRRAALPDSPPFFTAQDAGFVLGAPPDTKYADPYAVTPTQREAWLSHGYTVLEDLLTAEQVTAWRAVLDGAVDDRPRRMPMAEDPQNSVVSAMYTQRCGLRLNSAALNELVFAASAVAGGAAAQLNDEERGWRLYLDNVLIKEPWGDPTRWHVDTFSFGFDSHMTTSFWITLDDATERNGCLHFLRGSHSVMGSRDTPFTQAQGGRLAGTPLQHPGGVGDLFSAYPQLSTLEAAPAPVRAGTSTPGSIQSIPSVNPHPSVCRGFWSTLCYYSVILYIIMF